MRFAFPNYFLVESISGSHNPVARFVDEATPQRFEFSREECSKMDDDSLRYTILHELGHWFRVNRVELRDIESRIPEEGFLILGTPNCEEGFADAFAAHFMNDGQLDAHYPRQRAFLAMMISGREDEIEDRCVRMLELLKEQLRIERGRPVRSPLDRDALGVHLDRDRR